MFTLPSPGPDLDNEALGYLITLGLEEQQKVFMSADVLFSLKILVGSKKKIFVVRDEAPHFLRGSIGFILLSLYVNPVMESSIQPTSRPTQSRIKGGGLWGYNPGAPRDKGAPDK